MIKKSIKAFTLAEVLITLTIIGVIAALTIPNLIQSYKKHQVEVGVKTAYSIFSNAFKMAEAENGDMSSWSYPIRHNITVNEFFKTYLEPYLKIQKTCNNSDCYSIKTKGLNGEDWQRGCSESKSYVLSNGMSFCLIEGIIGFWNGTQINIFVDIDGAKKGKNQHGVDLFIFSLRHSGQIKAIYPALFEPGMANLEKSPSQLTYEELKNGCSPSASNSYGTPSGNKCAAIIQRNGWKIPDDYPVKKW